MHARLYSLLAACVSLLMLASSQKVHGEDPSPEVAGQKPNFVVIFVDDLGYADVGCFGAEVIRTPRIDQLAEEGMRFTDFYAQPICGPSRTALMTGCYPLRVAQHHNRYEIMPVVHSEEITIAEVLKEQGYATGCFGKWDMAGHSQVRYVRNLMPTFQGFDEYFGLITSNDNAIHFYRGRERVEPNADVSIVTQRYTDEAIAFIDQHQDEPFFLYLPHTMPHTRLGATEEFRGRSERGLYGDVVEELDFNIGRLIDALSERGLVENTYVLFTSDNGPWLSKNRDFQDGVEPGDHGGSAGPLRAGKGSTWEGGIRVPCVWWAPGRIPAGTTCEHLTATLDVMPTLAQLAGTEAPTDRIIDGLDISPLLAGHFDQADEERVFFYYSRGYLQAVRQGPWKLHLPDREPREYRTPIPRRHLNHPDENQPLLEPLLINLRDDLGETTNVADAHPEIVQRLTEYGEAARIDIGDYNLIGENARFFDSLDRHPPRPPAPNR